jgi:hypothetical protein
MFYGNGGKAIVHFVVKIGEIVLGGHVILDEIDGLKNVLCVFVHTREVYHGGQAGLIEARRHAEVRSTLASQGLNL